MKLTRRQLIRLSAGAGVGAALGGLAPLHAAPAGAPRAPNMTTIPSTGQQVPCVGIGTVSFRGSPGSADTRVFSDTLEVFHRLGGRLVDTSPNYGNSEELLGRMMPELGIRDELFLATKVDREDRDDGVARMESSFARLGGGRIDLMQVHNLRGTDEQLPTMKEWKEQGRFRYVGITTHSSGQYQEFEQSMRKHSLDFIQVNYSLADRGAAERILPLAQDKGVAVLVNRPFGKGSLFRAVKGQALPDWAGEIDAQSWGQVFLKYVVSHPAATLPIPGTSKPHHAEDNMGALYGRLPDAAMRLEMERFMDGLM
jgi:aryl-alcohol dehydrogenase-like predicted oxidoreductase